MLKRVVIRKTGNTWCRKRKTGPRPQVTGTENFVKSEHVFEMRADNQTYSSHSNFSHSLTKSSQPPNLRRPICITSSLFNLFAALAPRLTLPSLDDQHHPRYAYLIASSGMPHHVSGINFLVLSVNLIPVPLSPTCLFILLPHFLTLSTHHSHHP